QSIPKLVRGRIRTRIAYRYIICDRIAVRSGSRRPGCNRLQYLYLRIRDLFAYLTPVRYKFTVNTRSVQQARMSILSRQFTIHTRIRQLRTVHIKLHCYSKALIAVPSQGFSGDYDKIRLSIKCCPDHGILSLFSTIRNYNTGNIRTISVLQSIPKLVRGRIRTRIAYRYIICDRIAVRSGSRRPGCNRLQYLYLRIRDLFAYLTPVRYKITVNTRSVQQARMSILSRQFTIHTRIRQLRTVHINLHCYSIALIAVPSQGFSGDYDKIRLSIKCCPDHGILSLFSTIRNYNTGNIRTISVLQSIPKLVRGRIRTRIAYR